jgi:hypothetical protein
LCKTIWQPPSRVKLPWILRWSAVDTKRGSLFLPASYELIELGWRNFFAGRRSEYSILI